ncbi:MAG: type IV-A pilus assembly ATPase PilB [Bdellovibrionaceae bacterium]|nr:type IV-A pilus assembly ATPase PilB [Pseudobdellovibrionaceae bacterium]
MSKIGEILVKQGLVRPEQLARALEESRKNNSKLTATLVQLGFVKDQQVLKALEKHYQLPGVDLNTFAIQQQALDLVNRDFCDRHSLIPIQKVGETTLVVAFSDPTQIQIRDDLRFLTRRKIQPVVSTETSIHVAIEKYFGANVSDIVREVEQAQDAEEVEIQFGVGPETIDSGSEEEGPIIKFVNAIMTEAIRKKASDIHFEPYEKKFRVRFRIDGNMVEANSQPNSAAAAIASRIKIMSKLDIAEKRRPQDGRIKVRYKGGKDMDFRVSVMPTVHGEKVVLRLLDKSNLQLDMTKLGFEQEDLALFKDEIHRPQGMILITGPTGSGKTVTIYSALSELNKPDVNISTAEDPVEFNLDGINQLQVNPDIGLTFANALRSFLRQDPDVIMVGEIRDLETAEIAAKAASTGHLVVSTLHTNDAPQTVTRMVEMGVAPYVVTSTVSLIVAQRLVGRICEACKTPVEVQPQVLLSLGVPQNEIAEYHVYQGRGCNTCNNTGIKGRIAIFEFMKMSEKMKEAILGGASANQLRTLARQEGMRTLRRSALLKLKRGETTIQEVLNASVRDA